MVIPSLSRPDPLEFSWFIMFPLKRLQLGVSPGDIPKLVRHNHFWNHRRQLGANPLAPTGLQKKDGYYSYRHPQKGRKIKSHWYRDKSYCSTFLEIPKNLKLTDFGGFIGGSISTFWGSGPFSGHTLGCSTLELNGFTTGWWHFSQTTRPTVYENCTSANKS